MFLVLLISILMAEFKIKIYPSIKFPHFENKNKGNVIKYVKVEAKNKNNETIDLFELVKPFDKRIYLFSLRYLLTDKEKTLEFLNKNATENLKIDTVIITNKEIVL